LLELKVIPSLEKMNKQTGQKINGES